MKQREDWGICYEFTGISERQSACLSGQDFVHAAAFPFYLLSVGNRLDNVILILMFWLALTAVCETVRFLQRKKNFERILQTLSELDKPYLIGEWKDP